MLVIINSQGRVLAQQNDDLFQGSVNANVIDLVAPFPSNVVFKANVELADGTLLPEKLDGYILKPSVKVVDGLNVWRLLVNFPISKNSGIVTVQFRGEVGGKVVCTGTIKLNIQKGVPYLPNQDIEPELYDQVLQMVSDLKALLNDKVDVVNHKFALADYVTEDTVGYFYTYDELNDRYEQVILPEQYQTNVQYYTAEKVGRVVNGDNSIYFEYIDGEKATKVEILNDKVVINGQKVVVFSDLIAKNIAYDDKNSGIEAKNVQEALDKIKYAFNELGNSQVIDVGEHTFKSSSWYLEDGIYKIDFTNKLFTDALVQGIIVTPNKTAIDNLNANDILIYPEIDIAQIGETIAVARLKADKKPTFDIVANVKIQGTTIDAQTKGIVADQIRFVSTNTINAQTVQKAIEIVQQNINKFESTYETEKANFVKLDPNGKVPESLLPGFVDEIVEGYLHETQFYATKTDDGYSDLIPPVGGKIYVDLDTNKTYRWGGSSYVIMQSNLALGTTTGTAYDGGKGEANAKLTSNIWFELQRIIHGQKTVKKAEIAIYADEDTSKGTIEERLTKLGFSEGAFEIRTSNGTLLTGTEAYLVEYKNKIIKQGKICIGQLVIDSVVSQDLTITIPEQFRPKTNTIVTVAQTGKSITSQIIYNNGDFMDTNAFKISAESIGWQI
jgi:hypothetical protein